MSRHLFSAPVTGQAGSTLFIGLHYFGTSDRIEWAEPIWMRLLCLAMVQRLPDGALGEAATCLSGLYDFGNCLPSEPGSQPRVQWLSSGINGLIQRRIAAITHNTGTEDAVSYLSNLRDQLAGSLDYADHELGMLSERLELGDLSQPDQDDMRLTGVVARYVPYDSVLSCDPDSADE